MASRSILLIKVKIGICRIAQTLNSFRVWASTPLDAVDHHDRGVRRHQGTVGILGEVLMSRRIQDIDTDSRRN